MQGQVPAVLYGQGQDNLMLTVDPKALSQTLGAGSGLNVLFDLKIDGKDSVLVMVKDYQADILTRRFLHVDFYKVDLAKKILVEVPIQLVGKAPGIKEGGILEHITRSLKVRCLPTAIPEFLEADVSSLNIGDNIHAHNIKLPEGVEIPAGADFTIAAVAAPVEEKIEAPTGEIQQPEVLTEKKPAEESAPEKEEKKTGKEEKKAGKEEKK
jgi:large subunit ribosomal protein L25